MTIGSYCKVGSWQVFLGNQVINVRCFNKVGSAADTAFTAAYIHNDAWSWSAIDAAYLHANQPTTAVYTPASSYNSNATTNSVSRLGTGYYRADIPGMTATGGTVLVTAKGTGNQRCKVQGWSVTSVYVRCHTPAGAAVDTEFTMSYTYRMSPIGAGLPCDAFRGAYCWTNCPTCSHYSPNSTYQFIGEGGSGSSTSLLVDRLGTGSYSVYIPIPASLADGIPLVTAYGSTADYCTPWLWGGSSATTVYVSCWNSSGSLVDTRFTLTYQTKVVPVCLPK